MVSGSSDEEADRRRRDRRVHTTRRPRGRSPAAATPSPAASPGCRRARCRCVRSTAPVPSAAIVTISKLKPLKPEKAMLVPSGDHAGWKSKPVLFGQPRLAAAVGQHRVDLEVAVPAGDERELRTVGRPCRHPVGRRVGRDVDRVATVGVDHPHVEVAAAHAGEGDLRPVGRPRGLLVVARAHGQAGLLAPVGVHDVELAVTSVADARERDAAAVGRPRRLVVERRVVGEVRLAGAVDAHHVDLAVAIAIGPEREAGSRRPTTSGPCRRRRSSVSLVASSSPTPCTKHVPTAEAGRVEGDPPVLAGKRGLRRRRRHGQRRDEQRAACERGLPTCNTNSHLNPPGGRRSGPSATVAIAAPASPGGRLELPWRSGRRQRTARKASLVIQLAPAAATSRRIAWSLVTTTTGRSTGAAAHLGADDVVGDHARLASRRHGPSGGGSRGRRRHRPRRTRR